MTHNIPPPYAIFVLSDTSLFNFTRYGDIIKPMRIQQGLLVLQSQLMFLHSLRPRIMGLAGSPRPTVARGAHATISWSARSP
eukprot:CAMPEP_0114284624 /NCGR_PEP_ID=MMETSP0059-20121206/4748_1 /TAXON_ID=36894 /ORGANISM="Pyramimonas parkeae, Strain CCMP726" /LENGTH=81 /DNA_ID=CAMNT_0001405459 /DNA_START=157 /DNA_END=402 /DNA_ORIENTATION=-